MLQLLVHLSVKPQQQKVKVSDSFFTELCSSALLCKVCTQSLHNPEMMNYSMKFSKDILYFRSV